MPNKIIATNGEKGNGPVSITNNILAINGNKTNGPVSI